MTDLSEHAELAFDFRETILIVVLGPLIVATARCLYVAVKWTIFIYSYGEIS